MKKFTIFVSLISFLSILPVYASPSIKGLRISGTPDKLRLVFDLTERVQHKVFTLENPQRLVVDLQGADFENAIPELPKEVSFVRKIRSGSPDEGSLRVVLDLNETVNSKDFWLQPDENADYRLVLDLERLGKTIPVESRASHIEDAPTMPRRASAPRTAKRVNSANPSFTKILQANKDVIPTYTRTPRSAHREINTRLSSAQRSYVTKSKTPTTASRTSTRPLVATRTSSRSRIVAATRTSTRPLVATRTSSRSRVAAATRTRSTPNRVAHSSSRQARRQVAIRAKIRQQLRVAANTRVAAAARLAVGTNPWPNLRSVRGRDLIIVVDAGHGGKDTGAVGRRGTREKDIVLSVARRLARLIDIQSGMRAVLTRSTDVFIPLRGRVRRARRVHADLFVSIHADAARNRQAQGASVYVLSERGASSAAARALAARENASDLAGGVVINNKGFLLAKVLVDMSLSATMESSRQVAWNVLRKMYQIGEVHKGKVQYAGFAVLKAADIPSMLVETAYISNAEEEMKLRDPAFQDQLAGAVFSGIQEFFRNRPPAGTRIAQAVASRNSYWDRRQRTR